MKKNTASFIIFVFVIGMLVGLSIFEKTNMDVYVRQNGWEIAGEIKQRILKNINNDTLYGIITNQCKIYSPAFMKTDKYTRDVAVEITCSKFIGDSIAYIKSEQSYLDEKMKLIFSYCSDSVSYCFNKRSHDRFLYIVEIGYINGLNDILPWYVDKR